MSRKAKKLVAFRMNEKLLEKLRVAAFEEGRSQVSIVEEGLSLYLNARAIRLDREETEQTQSYTLKSEEC